MDFDALQQFVRYQTCSICDTDHCIIVYDINIAEDITYTLNRVSCHIPKIIRQSIIKNIDNLKTFKLYTIKDDIVLPDSEFNKHGQIYTIRNNLMSMLNKQRYNTVGDIDKGFLLKYRKRIVKLFKYVIDKSNNVYLDNDDIQQITSHIRSYINKIYGFVKGCARDIHCKLKTLNEY